MHHKKLYNLSLILPLLSLFLFSCASNETADSDKVAQSEIYQSYSGEYNATDKQFYASASFRFGGTNGTTLLLVNSSRVLCNQEEMVSRNNYFVGTYYDQRKEGEHQKNLVFEYTDNNGKKYKNGIELESLAIKSFDPRLDTLKDYTVKWDNALKGDHESITLYLTDSKNNEVSVFTTAKGTESLTFKTSDLRNRGLKGGKATLHLIRRALKTLEEGGHLGGNISYTYISTKVDIEI